MKFHTCQEMKTMPLKFLKKDGLEKNGLVPLPLSVCSAPVLRRRSCSLGSMKTMATQRLISHPHVPSRHCCCCLMVMHWGRTKRVRKSGLKSLFFHFTPSRIWDLSFLIYKNDYSCGSQMMHCSLKYFVSCKYDVNSRSYY